MVFILNQNTDKYIYIWGSAKNLIGWPRYSYGMGPNEVYFST